MTDCLESSETHLYKSTTPPPISQGLGYRVLISLVMKESLKQNPFLSHFRLSASLKRASVLPNGL